MWLGIEFESCLIREFPLQLLSETWIGLPTGEGELCYGSQTHARLDRELLLNLPYRALTPVSLQNKGEENFTLERFSIPAPFLSLCEGDSQLVTEQLSVVLEPETQRVTVEIGSSDHDKVIASPRKHSDKNILVNTWENLFS